MARTGSAPSHTLTNALKRLAINEVVLSQFVEAAQKAHPGYFSDLPTLPADAR